MGELVALERNVEIAAVLSTAAVEVRAKAEEEAREDAIEKAKAAMKDRVQLEVERRDRSEAHRYLFDLEVDKERRHALQRVVFLVSIEQGSFGMASYLPLSVAAQEVMLPGELAHLDDLPFMKGEAYMAPLEVFDVQVTRLQAQLRSIRDRRYVTHVKPILCKFFLHRRCTRGKACKFSHDHYEMLQYRINHDEDGWFSRDTAALTIQISWRGFLGHRKACNTKAIMMHIATKESFRISGDSLIAAFSDKILATDVWKKHLGQLPKKKRKHFRRVLSSAIHCFGPLCDKANPKLSWESYGYTINRLCSRITYKRYAEYILIKYLGTLSSTEKLEIHEIFVNRN